ncbi:hypothetical protein P3342_013502 [Pyrenophora teres f. teres]|nr:hypothetical protein P3342_013502 [Pyrenophora teres f. teres]
MAGVVDSLRKQITACEATLQDLRRELAEAERSQDQEAKVVPYNGPQATDPTNPLDHDMNFGVPDDFRSEILPYWTKERMHCRILLHQGGLRDGRSKRKSTRDMEGN